MITQLSIDADRLYDALTELGRIGAYTDEPTGLVGVRRLALHACASRPSANCK